VKTIRTTEIKHVILSSMKYDVFGFFRSYCFHVFVTFAGFVCIYGHHCSVLNSTFTYMHLLRSVKLLTCLLKTVFVCTLPDVMKSK